MREAVWGAPPADLAAAGADAVQVSPLSPGAGVLEEMTPGSLDRIVMAAPAGSLERRYALAQALRVLAPGGELVALASKTRGGARLAAELTGFGCEPAESAKRHHRVCRTIRPREASGLEAAISAGGPQVPPGLGLWSQPGVFSWDRPDAGSARLIAGLPALAGQGADFGCGVGALAREVLRSGAVAGLRLVDIDRRAVEAARRNLDDPRASLIQADVRTIAFGGLDFVVMNPPFHFAGEEDRGLGAAFIRAAARALRRGGLCLMVANAMLPYESALGESFRKVRLVDRSGGYKIHEARA